MTKVDIILQARMGSTRLPGKVLKPLLAKPMLHYQIERLRRTTQVSEIIVATTTRPEDEEIERFCISRGILCFRGDESDVMGRYVAAAAKYHTEVVVRLTGDCPLIDPEIVDTVIGGYLKDYPCLDYVSNTLVRTYPRGMDVEVFSKRKLDEIAKLTNDPADREHVTRYFYTHPREFKLKNIASDRDDSRFRLTVDTEEDFILIRKIIEELYPVKPEFKLNDILDILSEHPEWEQINRHTKQKEI